jgi:Fe-S-cluster-containing hydrogenase component 2
MVPGTWLLACALLGAGSVVSQPCTAGGCPLGLDQHSLRAIDLAREALIQVGFNPVTVPASVEDVATPIGRIDLKDPFGRDGPVEVFLALSHMADATPTFSHRGAGIGVVEIDRSACTLCTQCATTCPTGALGTSFEGETVSLTFDTSLCTDCRQCILACPEIEHDAIAVEGRVDFGRLTAGRQLVNEGTVLLCESCRQPIAPAPMMDRIGELLGDEFSETMEYLVRRCIDCRGLS